MIAHTLRDFGTSSYVIQEKELSPERLHTAFSITVIVAWTLALALWLAATPLSSFYAEPGVAMVLKVMSLNFVLIPFGSISVALLRREMKFRAIMFITGASAMAHSLSCVVLAALDFGFISLAWGAVIGSLTTVIGSWAAQRKGFMFRLNLAERKRVLSFSLRSSVASVASEAGHAAPDIVLGRTLGMEATGLFSRAMGYVQLFERLLQDVLRSVMLPYLAEEVRAGGDIRAKLRLALVNITSISLFIIGLTGVLAEPMIALLFGAQWEAAVPVAQVLCLAMALRCMSPTLAAALVAKGAMKEVMRASLASALAKFALMILLSAHGLMLAAIAFALAEAVSVAFLLHYCSRNGVFLWVDYLGIMGKCLPIALAGLVPALVIQNALPPPESPMLAVWHLAAAGSVACLLWLILIWVLNSPPKAELIRLTAVIRQKLG